MPTKKKTRVAVRLPPEGQGNMIPVQFRFEPELLAKVDQRIADANVKRVIKWSRTDVVRLLLHGWLLGKFDPEAVSK
jgi:hypothetical protein